MVGQGSLTIIAAFVITQKFHWTVTLTTNVYI